MIERKCLEKSGFLMHGWTEGMAVKKSYDLGLFLLLIFILAIFVIRSDSGVRQSFEWATTYVLPWLVFAVAVDYLYRKRK